MPRIALPVKLLLSYLVILLLGAGPTVFYISEVLPNDVLSDNARHLSLRAKRVVHQIAELPPAERLNGIRAIGQLSTERITYLSAHGDVLFDTELTADTVIENHASRPEIRQAMGDTTLPPEPFATDPILDRTGVARRVSATRNVEFLYVAVPIANAQNEIVGVLRLAMPLSQIQAYNRSTVRFIRNATAVAMTAAIGFSLAAAVIFVRPLQRVRVMVTSLTEGDMGAKVAQPGNDEVGDIGRALNHMATALRRKLLDAGLGEALISQLVETLPCPCVVFAEEGEVVAMNGHGRRALRIEGPLAGQHMREFAEHQAVQAAVQCAEQEGEPEPLSVTLTDSFPVCGFMHVLKRPGTAPLRVFFGAELPTSATALLPELAHIGPRALADVLMHASRRYNAAWPSTIPPLELPIVSPLLMIADADDRMVDAVKATLVACAELLPRDGSALRVTLIEDKTRLGLHLELELPKAASATVRPLIEPLGGSLDVAPQDTKLWLPRA